MKKLFSDNKHIILILAVATVIFTFTVAGALDYPHNEQNFIGCDSCHYVLGTNESLMPDGLIFGLNIDDTQKNALCWSCHNGSDAPLMRTHSSLQTDDDYGDWTVECVTCHDPHDQDMVQFYGNMAYVVTGTSTDIQTDTPVPGQSQLTEAGNSWIPNAYAGYLLVPNTNYGEKFAYKILSNTADTLTVEGIINPLWYFVGDPFGIMRGRLIRSSVNLEEIIDPLNPQLGFRAVRHFNDDSDPGFPGNFPDSFADGDGIDGICEICHQETTYHRNDASADTTHNLGADCTSCHNHLNGMKADCDACHGEPPTTDDQTPPTGLVWNPPAGTGSTTAGAHNLHVNTMPYGCETCHVDSAGSGPTHNNSLIVTIGFSMFGATQQGGDYVGQPAVSYNTTSTTPPTTAISGTGGAGDKTCSNIYCHGNYNGSGLNASPVWDNPASVSCGTCHDASNSADSAPDSGSHEKHADSDQTINTVPKTTFNRNYACTLCHEGIVGGSGPSSYTIADTTKHVNGFVNWSFDSSDSRTAIGTPSYSIASGTAEPSDGTTPRAYGTCTVYCHSNVQPDGGAGAPDVYAAPPWGTTVTCGDCHKSDGSHMAGLMDSGSHTDHLQYTFTTAYSGKKCNLCHKYDATATDDGSCNGCHTNGEQTDHVDGTVDVLFDTAFTGATASYNDTSGTPGAPGNGYFDCSNVYCHSTGQSTTDGGSAVPAYSNPTWANAASGACGTCHEKDVGSLTSGSHDPHLQSPVVAGCGDCHDNVLNDASAYNSLVTHVNKKIDVAAANTYSLGDAGDPGDGYGTCSTASCHGGVSPQWGIDNTGIDECTTCHGTRTGPVATDAQKAPPRDTDGDTLASNEEVGAHQAHVTLPSGYTDKLNNTANCNECHKVPGTVNAAGHIDSLRPAEVLQDSDQTYDKADLDSVTPNYNYTNNTCTVYCHGASLAEGSDTSPTWNDTAYLSGSASDNDDGSGDCEKCHGSAPTTVSPHTAGMGLSGAGASDSCNDCHTHFNDGGTLNNAALHIDGTVDFSDDCDTCHGNSGATLPAAHAAHVQSAYVGTLSGGDYGNTASGWYDWDNTGGTLDVGCGYCHPQSDATHNNGTKNVTLNPDETGAAGTVRALNGAGAAFAAGVCNQVYCHSDGNDDATPGVYGWQASPDWSTGSVSGACTDCHGNSPTTNSHGKHIVGIHYDTIYTGTSGLASAGNTNVDAHGNATYSTTINCSTCHKNTVTTSANDQSTSCNTAACHDGAPRLMGDMAIDGGSNVHVDGNVDIALDAISVRSKAQIRDDITTVTELDNNWDRTVSGVGYKAAGAFDEAKNALNTGTMFNSESRVCSNIACHNSNAINWGAKGISCDSCHTNLTQ